MTFLVSPFLKFLQAKIFPITNSTGINNIKNERRYAPNDSPASNRNILKTCKYKRKGRSNKLKILYPNNTNFMKICYHIYKSIAFSTLLFCASDGTRTHDLPRDRRTL